MNDLRHDPYTETHAVTDDYGRRLYTVTTVQDCPDASKPKPAEAFAALRARFGAHFDAMDPDQLRTVPMPELRTPHARSLYDTRTEDERLLAELVRIVDALQALTLRLEMVENVLVELAKAAGIQEAQ